MGLDREDLISEVEIRYGVEIPDEAAASARTVSELHEHVLNEVKAKDAATRLVPHCFLRVRRALHKDFGYNKEELRPETPLAGLFPPKKRKEDWEKLYKSLGLLLPALKLPIWVHIATAALLLGGLASIFLHLEEARYIMPVCAVLTLALWKLTYPLKRQFPSEVKTLNDLAYSILRANTRAINLGPDNPPDMLHDIGQIVAKQLGLGFDEVKPESRLAEDLGVE